MNGDNNLCRFANKDVAELQTGNVSDSSNIIVGFDCSKANDSKLIKVNGKEIEVLDSGSEYDMGDVNFLTKVTNKVFEKYPSKKRMVIIWNHGSGWNIMSEQDPLTKGISYDDESGNHITTAQLGAYARTINARYHLNILGFDACLMQMVEIAYEVGAAGADYILASEETEPGDGWDYAAMVKTLASYPSAVELGSSIVEAYGAFYNDTTSTLSLVNTESLEYFVSAFSKFLSSADMNKVKLAMRKSKAYYYKDFKDIGSFIGNYGNAETLRIAYEETVIANYGAGTGLSIYFSDQPNSAYKNLQFYKATGWLFK
jgi:hypothetical protein